MDFILYIDHIMLYTSCQNEIISKITSFSVFSLSLSLNGIFNHEITKKSTFQWEYLFTQFL